VHRAIFGSEGFAVAAFEYILHGINNIASFHFAVIPFYSADPLLATQGPKPHCDFLRGVGPAGDGTSGQELANGGLALGCV
jgi:hypothetical protein